MRNRLRLRLSHFILIEAVLVGFFFISATRFLIGHLYSRSGGASIVFSLDPALIPAGSPGVIDAATLTNEISFLVYMLVLPLITLLLGRIRWIAVVAVILVALGRGLMVAETAVTPIIASALVFGGGMLYIAQLVRYRAQALPYFFVVGIAFDQLVRALGNTLDPTWSGSTVVLALEGGTIPFLNVQIGLSVLMVILSLATIWSQQREEDRRPRESRVTPDWGLMPFWGGIGLGALLFLQLAFLGTANALAGRSGSDYTNFAPLVTLATLLPIIPWVRGQVAAFVAAFDRTARGWLWMLVIALLIVFGTRFQGLIAGAALVLAQFATSLLWWWLVRPRTEKERQVTGLWLVVAVLIFVLLAAADNMTYEYAYVGLLPPELAFLNETIPPFLRAFRGLGLGVILLSVFLAALPMVQTQRRIPWVDGQEKRRLFGVGALVAAAFSIGVAVAVRPPVIAGVRGVDTLRIGTYNIHGGFNEFYHFDLEAIARTIQQSGADVVLLQQVETGRLTSFSVNQSLWLARRLGMDTRFFPANEGLQGLAVLSRVEISQDEGYLLTSPTYQTGLQRVQIRPDDGVLTLYNTRLEYLQELGDGRTLEQQEQDQQLQLNEVFAIISRLHPDGNLGRTIVGGTFNNIPDSPLSDQMRAAGFIDPFAGLPVELAATLVRTGYPQVQLDYLWVWRRSILPVGANTINALPYASDHRMAVIAAQIREPSS